MPDPGSPVLRTYAGREANASPASGILDLESGIVNHD